MQKQPYYYGFRKGFFLIFFAVLCGLTAGLITHGWLFAWSLWKGFVHPELIRSWIGIVIIFIIGFLNFESPIKVPIKRMVFSAIFPLVLTIYFKGKEAAFTYLFEDVMINTSKGIIFAGFLSIIIDKSSPIRYE